jgi:nitrogen fixation protein NifU and related proteins
MERDRQEQIDFLIDHYQHPVNRRALPDADVTIPGGNPGCGDIVTIFAKIGPDGEHMEQITFTGEGCTISQAAASIVMEKLQQENPSFEQIKEMDYKVMEEELGHEAMAMRPRCATLALGTVKAAVKKIERDRMLRAAGVEPPPAAPFVAGEA